MNIKTLLTACFVSFCALSFGQETYTLQKCKELALQNNLEAKNSQLSIEAAQQTKKEAFTNYFPSISATGLGFMTNKPMMSMEMDMSELFDMMWMPGVPPIPMNMLENGLIGAVMATQPVFVGGQIINGNKLAKLGVEVSEIQKQMSNDELLLNTEQYYWMIVSLTEKIKTIEEAESMLSRMIKDVDMMVQAGLTTGNDLLRVELEQNKLASNKLKVENGLKIAKMVLGQCIGVAPDDFTIEKPAFDDITPPIGFYAGHEEALLQRSEYRLLDKSVDAAKLQMKMKQGENLPMAAVGLGYNYFVMDKGKEAEMDNNFGMVFATVSVPISGWWGGSHAVKKHKIEMQIAENTKQQVSEQLLVQMQQLRNELDEAYKQLLIAEKSTIIARENLRQSTDHYQAGTTILSDLLDAQSLLQQSLDQYTDAATGYYIALARYKNAIGN